MVRRRLAKLGYAKNGLRRFIYVAPYLTIIEQNADVMRGALGLDDHPDAVFEHHSLSDPPGTSDNDPAQARLTNEDGRTADRSEPHIKRIEGMHTLQYKVHGEGGRTQCLPWRIHPDPAHGRRGNVCAAAIASGKPLGHQR